MLKKEENMKKTMESLKKDSENAAELSEQVKTLTKDNTKMKKELDGFDTKFREEQTKRKNLLNELEDMKGKIRVYARIRPFSKTEKEDPDKFVDCYEIPDTMTLTIPGRITNNYNFDSVFGPDSTQEQIFDETKRLVQSAIDGYNVCIFAYGQTGSGKTFTIQGSNDLPGLTPRAIRELFDLTSKMGSSHDLKLSCYLVELYKDNLNDLLLDKKVKDRPKIEIRFNKDIE